MALWVVRAGKHGEQEETAIKERLVCHAWNELPNYSSCKTKAELAELYAQTYPHANDKQAQNGVGQVWRFAKEIQPGDLVALPLRTESAFLFGKIVSEYTYKEVAPNVIHIRMVEWIKKIPRSAFPKEILFSMNSALTLFKVTRNDAETRVKKILADATASGGVTELASGAELDEATDESEVNLEVAARDEILKFIQSNFKEHDLARLVDAILRAQGYKTVMSPPGPDGGVDILAGSGTLGFDQPRLCVQVKSGNTPEGQKTFNEFLGVVSKFASQHGLFVSWAGFTNPVKSDAKKEFFRIRLWDQGNVVDAILNHYEQLDDDIKAELPLKRIWIKVREDVE